MVGLSIMFQGIQAVAMPLAQEFGFTREIEDRVQAPCPIWLVAISKVISGAAQGLISAIIVFPIASVVHAAGVEAHINLHWGLILTLVPLSCICMASLGLLLGTSFEPRNLGLMFGFIVLPITFLGGTYYQWTRLSAVKLGSVHWLQIVVLINPLIYINDGMRAAFTDAAHMHLYVIYPAIVAFSVVFLTLGLAKLPPQGSGLSHRSRRTFGGRRSEDEEHVLFGPLASREGPQHREITGSGAGQLETDVHACPHGARRRAGQSHAGHAAYDVVAVHDEFEHPGPQVLGQRHLSPRHPEDRHGSRSPTCS